MSVRYSVAVGQRRSSERPHRVGAVRPAALRPHLGPLVRVVRLQQQVVRLACGQLLLQHTMSAPQMSYGLSPLYFASNLSTSTVQLALNVGVNVYSTMSSSFESIRTQEHSSPFGGHCDTRHAFVDCEPCSLTNTSCDNPATFYRLKRNHSKELQYYGEFVRSASNTDVQSFVHAIAL